MGFYVKDLKFDLGSNIVKGKKEAKERLKLTKEQMAQENARANRSFALQKEDRAYQRAKDKQNQEQYNKELNYKHSLDAKAEQRYNNEYKDKQIKLDLEQSEKKLNKESIIDAMKKMHPKTTAGLTDNEIYVMADKIENIHADKTSRKFLNSWTASNGDKVASFLTGYDKDGNPITVNEVLGKAKDYSASKKSKDDKSTKEDEKLGKIYVKKLGKYLTKEEYKRYTQNSIRDKKTNKKEDFELKL